MNMYGELRVVNHRADIPGNNFPSPQVGMVEVALVRVVWMILIRSMDPLGWKSKLDRQIQFFNRCIHLTVDCCPIVP